jgi:hypothetical protein
MNVQHRVACLGIPESQEVELTLYTTVAYGNLDAFWELLRLGARLDVPNTWHGCLEDLIEQVFSPENDWELLHWFYGTGIDAQLSPEAHDYIIRPLLKVIRASGQRGRPPLGALRMLLDRRAGGPLNEVYVGFSPLAAAIRQQQYDPIPVLDLLLGAGVSIDGPVCESPIPSPMGILIFAAVEAIAMRGDTNLVEWCVRNGANINPWQGLTEIAFGHYYATPIRFYLATFDSWAGNPWDPVKGLQLLLDRGAKMDFSPDDVGNGQAGSATDSPSPQRSVRWFWCLKALLSNRSMTDILTIPSYRRMVEYVIQLHAETEDATAAETLSHCEAALRGKPELNPSFNSSEKYSAAREAISSAWKIIVKDIILPTYQLGSTEILAQYILHKGRCIEPVDYLSDVPIEILLAAGADINARLADTQDGSTILHQLCREIGRVWRDSPTGCRALCTWEPHIRSFSLIEYVLGKGADRRVRTLDGRTARGLLLERLDLSQCERLARMHWISRELGGISEETFRALAQ